MKEPTQEQIKAFWEWCGLTHIDNPIPPEAINSCEAIILDRPVNGWYKPDYQKGESKLISVRDTPILDLNNLFKYAVPKTLEILKNNYHSTIIGARTFLFNRWITRLETIDDDANSLFWTIWEVITEDKPC